MANRAPSTTSYPSIESSDEVVLPFENVLPPTDDEIIESLKNDTFPYKYVFSVTKLEHTLRPVNH